MNTLSVPDFYDQKRVLDFYEIDYDQVFKKAYSVKKKNRIKDYNHDVNKRCLVMTGFQHGRKDANIVDNMCKFIYKNAENITDIFVFNEADSVCQIDKSFFWINESKQHPPSGYVITRNDFKTKKWKVNPSVLSLLSRGKLDPIKSHIEIYLDQVGSIEIKKYSNMRGSSGSGVFSSIEESLFYYSIIRGNQVFYFSYNEHPVVRNRSVFNRDISSGAYGGEFKGLNFVIDKINKYNNVIVGGFGKSVVLETAKDLYNDDIKVTVLEDCCDIRQNASSLDFASSEKLRFS